MFVSPCVKSLKLQHKTPNFYFLVGRRKGPDSFKRRYHQSCHEATIQRLNSYTWGSTEFGSLGLCDETVLSWVHFSRSDTHIRWQDRMDSIIVQYDALSGSHQEGQSLHMGWKWGLSMGAWWLGHWDENEKNSPTLVEALEGKHITQVQCGTDHTTMLWRPVDIYSHEGMKIMVN